MTKKRILVLSVDRDNDLFEKVGLSGPIIGREANLAAATKLLLADPEETDGNTLYEAVKIADSLAKQHETVEIATLTGSKRLGYEADSEITKQLERVLTEFHAQGCIFVTDGASDEQVLPLVQSRVKIDSMKTVTMKQSKELEKTYFVLLDKLKEPYYAGMFFGVPGLILLILAVSEYLGYGWKPLGVILGSYLILKALGLDEVITSRLRNPRFSVESISFVAYLAAIPLGLISLWMGVTEWQSAAGLYGDPLKIAAAVTRSLLILLPIATILVLAGRVIDLWREKKTYEMVRYGLYGVSVVLVWYIFSTAASWVLADSYFSDFVLAVAISSAIALATVRVTRSVRAAIASGMKLENKEALSDIGAYVGKIVGVDRRHGQIVVQTPFGQRLTFGFDAITSVGDKVLLRH